MKLLILGCGRGGTHYIAQVLKAMGADFSHETVYPGGMSSWFMAADDPDAPHLWKDGVFRPCRISEFDHVAHQTRHPLSVIRSWKPRPASREQIEFIEKYTGCRDSMGAIEFGMRYWLDWNHLCEYGRWDRKAELRYQVENIDIASGTESLNALCEACDVRIDVNARMPPHSNKTTEQLDDVTWGDLYEVDLVLAREIQNTAERYGYDT